MDIVFKKEHSATVTSFALIVLARRDSQVAIRPASQTSMARIQVLAESKRGWYGSLDVHTNDIFLVSNDQRRRHLEHDLWISSRIPKGV